jgi:hypothetical protein
VLPCPSWPEARPALLCASHFEHLQAYMLDMSGCPNCVMLSCHSWPEPTNSAGRISRERLASQVTV